MNTDPSTSALIHRAPPWLLGAWTFLLLQFRPSIVGESHNPHVFALFALVTLTILWSRGKNNFFVQSRRRWIGFVLILLAANYFLCQGLVISNAPGTVLNSTIVILGSVASFYLVLDEASQPVVLRSFIWIHFVLALSAIVTLSLFIAGGFDIQNVPVFAKLHTYSRGSESAVEIYGEHSVLFPFTIIWSSMNLLGIQFPRFVGMYREPGMAQIFFFTAYFLAYWVPIARPMLVRRVLLAGALLTFSTSGLLSFLGGSLCLWLFNSGRRRSAGEIGAMGILTVVLLSTLLFAPHIGILSKAQHVSGLVRLESLAASVEAFRENFWFGQGYYSGFLKDKSGVAISEVFHGILDISRQIGFVGLTLYFLAWWWGVLRLGRWKSLFLYMPCFLTLWTQPSYNDVIVWFLLMLDTSKEMLPSRQVAPAEQGLSAAPQASPGYG